MTRAEEAIRATTLAIASTVADVPPLRLETAPDELGFSGDRPSRQRWRGRRLRTWIVPAAAAATVAAVAIALVLIRNIPNGRVAPPSPIATSAAPAAGSVPEYYVAWMQADRPYLLVGNTRNGGSEGIIPSPRGIYLNGVYGAAADDRTFIVTGTRVPAPGTTVLYLLRLRQGRTPMTMATLPISVSKDPAGVALSPDGTQVAVAVNGSPSTLRVYSVTTGALLHTWSATGKFAAFSLNLSDDRAEQALRWSPDGSHVGFAWNAREIRAIPATTPDGSLLTSSTSLLAIGATYTGMGSAFICHAWQGWSLVAGGNGVLCAGSEDMSGASRPAGDKPLNGSVGFVLERHFADGSEETSMIAAAPLKTTKAGPEDDAYLGWANADGTVVIGSTVAEGKTRFGIFRNGRFSALPALPGAGALVPAGVLYGADVW